MHLFIYSILGYLMTQIELQMLYGIEWGGIMVMNGE
jgi:hypothetical protein